MNVDLVANTIRGLAMDGVQKAESGHPGAPMGLADYASVLFLKHLKYNPNDPQWPDRDRFVLSAGHASMLLYSLLHLAGYDVSLDEIRNFRQWDSITPGHPEFGLTPGVETTTGPLGQGCGNAVGMALAEAMLAARFNKEHAAIVDHFTYVIAGDGDLMEGVSHEVFSLAGHLKLGKLILFYDSNRITIEGGTDLAYSDDVGKRFEGYHWHVQEIDGHDHGQIEQALEAAKAETEKPSIIIGHTHIAKGSPNKQDTSKSHGEPLGEDEIIATKKLIGVPPDKTFYVPDEVRDIFAKRKAELKPAYDAWNETLAEYRKQYPDDASRWDLHQNRVIPKNIRSVLPEFEAGKSMATRKASGAVIQALAQALPQLIGGSADLGPSNNTVIKDAGSVSPADFTGRNLHFGVREHGMGAILNGIALHRGFLEYGGTFLIFSDYFKPAIRLASLMELPVIYVFTHDSIFLGEDGPTHQAVEQLAGLRAIPNLAVIRPADAAETAEAWVSALERTKGPTALALTRQNVPTLDRRKVAPAHLLQQGAYVLWQAEPKKTPDIILIATGSEVSITLEAAENLAAEGINARVVSMPSWELFEDQPAEVRVDVLPPSCKCRLAVEAGASLGWERYVRTRINTISIDRFGASAPYQVLADKFGFTADNIAATAKRLLEKESSEEEPREVL